MALQPHHRPPRASNMRAMLQAQPTALFTPLRPTTSQAPSFAHHRTSVPVSSPTTATPRLVWAVGGAMIGMAILFGILVGTYIADSNNNQPAAAPEPAIPTEAIAIAPTETATPSPTETALPSPTDTATPVPVLPTATAIPYTSTPIPPPPTATATSIPPTPIPPTLIPPTATPGFPTAAPPTATPIFPTAIAAQPTARRIPATQVPQPTQPPTPTWIPLARATPTFAGYATAPQPLSPNNGEIIGSENVTFEWVWNGQALLPTHQFVLIGIRDNQPLELARVDGSRRRIEIPMRQFGNFETTWRWYVGIEDQNGQIFAQSGEERFAISLSSGGGGGGNDDGEKEEPPPPPVQE